MSKRVAGNPGASFVKPAATEPEFDPARPGRFDLPGFIAGVKKPTNTRTVAVTLLPGVAAELERLTDEAAQIRAVQDEPENSPRRRLAQRSGKAERLAQIEARTAELEPLLDGTWLDVKLRGLTPSEQDAIRALKLTPGVDLAAAIFAVVGLVRDPDEATGDDDGWGAMDAAGWTELIDVIGQVQFLTLDKAHDALAYQAVTPDFYERYSASRATRTSSSS